LYGQVRTAKFAEPACNAILGSHRIRLAVAIEFKDFLGTEVDADTASLAPFFVDYVLDGFAFFHNILLVR